MYGDGEGADELELNVRKLGSTKQNPPVKTSCTYIGYSEFPYKNVRLHSKMHGPVKTDFRYGERNQPGFSGSS
jgi:hypothetical protein